MSIKPIDIQKLDIELSSSPNPAARVAGLLVRINREMVAGFNPWTDRDRFKREIDKDNQAIKARRAKTLL